MSSATRIEFNGLRELAAGAGRGYARGIAFYTGEQFVPFDERRWAVPLGVLWAGGASGPVPLN